MEFKLIRESVIKELNKRYLINIQTEEELKKELGFYNKTYIGDFEKQKDKLLKFVRKRRNKEIDDKLIFIKSIEDADNFKGELIITLEWKKSYMWGSNPRAYTNYGFNGESIGGCGYCKTSTATAQALNSHLPILKLLYKKEEERLNKKPLKDRRDFIGYGSGYYSLPIFEGGVGVSSHEYIIKNLGLNMRCITNTSQTDVYLIKKMSKAELKSFKEKGY